MTDTRMSEREALRERSRKVVEKLRPIDDTLMRRIFKDNLPLAQKVLRTITGLRELTLVREETQVDLKQISGSHSVILDVWGLDGDGVEYDLEVQTGSIPQPKRERYYSASMDVFCLKAGSEYEELPTQWIVVIYEEDPFGEGRPTYHFMNLETNTGEPFGDATHKLYANGAYDGDDELGSLMRDFAQSDPSRIKDPLLRERVEYLKGTQRGMDEMCEIVEKFCAEEAKLVEERSLLNSIRSLRETLNVDSLEAMRLLKVPEADRPRYLALL